MALEVLSNQSTKYWRIEEWFPHLSQEALDQLKLFHSELIVFNKAINLISNRTEESADLVHFADCLIGSEHILKASKGRNIYDFGSGNGLPGIILAILAPNYRVHLVESDARKIEFMKYVGTKLGLRNLVPLHCRVEDLKEDSVELVVSRGFASVQKSLLVARKPCKINAQYFHFKGEGWVREVADIPSQMCRFWIPMHLTDYSLPAGNTRLSIVVTKKMA